uniref:Reverse transcriptase domain-containing protein n=1 Tax=Passalora fulva TaxID=5499 RepID=A0A9Q8PCU6_PASFU
MATLLPALESQNTATSGFVDDTNILAWSSSTKENCRLLEEKHKICEDWARRHGARFAPEKYNLIHFTRRPRFHNMQASIQIQGHTTNPANQLRILGLWVDPALRWRKHVQAILRKAEQNMASCQRLTASTWGADFRQSRLLYTAIVRPVFTYGSQVWSLGERACPSKGLVAPLAKIQNQCLRKVTGAYKSTPTRMLEHETAIPPIDLYIQGLRTSYLGKSAQYPVQKVIASAVARARESVPAHKGIRPGNEPNYRARDEQLATQWEGEKSFVEQLWKERWNNQVVGHSGRPQPAGQPKEWSATKSAVKHPPKLIHYRLTRAQSSIATQLRSEHIGLQGYLSWRKVLGYTNTSCPYGYRSQNVRHALLVCPRWSLGRGEWMAKARNRTIRALLNNAEDLRRITNWILEKGWLEQYRLVGAVQEERTRRSATRPARSGG